MAREIGRLKGCHSGEGEETGSAGRWRRVFICASVRPEPEAGYSIQARGSIAMDMGIGPLHTISLAEARASLAQGMPEACGLGRIDPIEARRAGGRGGRRGSPPPRLFRFANVRKSYIASHQAGWLQSEACGGNGQRTLEAYVYPAFRQPARASNRCRASS